jgi:hypothetical protein
MDNAGMDDAGMDDAERRTATARLFDVRRVIGGLFVVYGVIVTVMGLFDSGADLTKAQGVRINLWTGLAMLVFGALMLVWQWLRPLELGPERDGNDDPAPNHDSAPR